MADGVGCMILAAGEGRRFGAPKQLATLRGRPLLAHALAAAAPWDPVVVLGAHADAIRAQIDLARWVVADDWADGQSASLRAGVRALGAVECAIVLLADMPFVNGHVIAGALEHLPGHDAVRTVYRGRPAHPVVLGRRVLDAVPALRGDVGARELLARFDVCTWEAGHLCDPTDIDTPDELEAVQ